MTKIDIISGFLGAGKTTLIKKLLKEAFQGEKLVLIENEFGEIGIDGGFLQESGVQVTEMNSGCICCSLVGDFGAALTEVIETYAPDRVIIEPSGVGKLSDVIKAVENLNLRTGIVLNSAAVVADAKKSRMYMKNFGEFFNNQIEHAGTIILSRTQDLKEDKLLACVKEIKEHNPHAVIITTPWEELSGDVILKEMENRNSLEQQLLEEEKVCETCGHHHDHHEHNHECGHDHHEHDHECNHEHNHECGHDHHEHSHKCNHDHGHHEHNHECNHEHHADEHHADEIFSSWGVETPQKFNQEALKNMLEKLTETDAYGIILRAKGMLQSEDGKWMYFDLVPGEYEVRDGLPQATGRICVIGSKIKNEEIAKLFGVA